jgi:hypothetical protein
MDGNVLGNTKLRAARARRYLATDVRPRMFPCDKRALLTMARTSRPCFECRKPLQPHVAGSITDPAESSFYAIGHIEIGGTMYTADISRHNPSVFL